ncbi:hypothetical protein MKOR_24170 [Mycolicibacillus koreensis]|nr:hypothetical protein MKOR_24170 [Mycolicibacillus koreensis]
MRLVDGLAVQIDLLLRALQGDPQVREGGASTLKRVTHDLSGGYATFHDAVSDFRPCQLQEYIRRVPDQGADAIDPPPQHGDFLGMEFR